jgi:peptidoglycan/LPS O-acetylase OafA/YrhL
MTAPSTSGIRDRIDLAEPARGEYRAQLDSLRAFAVFAVIVGHLASRATEAVPLGELGVRLFFVLSGFLITGILLRCRALIADGASSVSVIGRFYARRLLRIAPAFYGLLAVMWLAAIPELRDSLPWHVAYFSNIYFARLGQWHGATSHFWSLAVEEQFYLVWPMIVLFQPLRRMNAILAVVVVSAPLFRMLGLWNGWSPITTLVLPFGAADSLALGALLASLSQTDTRARSQLTTIGRWLGPAAFVLTALPVFHVTAGGILGGALFATVWSLWFVWLLDRAAGGFQGRLGALLEMRPIVYFGQISYGLYLFHNLAPRVVKWLWEVAALTSDYPPNAFIGVGAPIVVTILLASLSWRFYERPINRLKRHIPYEGIARSPRPPSEVQRGCELKTAITATRNQ